MKYNNKHNKLLVGLAVGLAGVIGGLAVFAPVALADTEKTWAEKFTDYIHADGFNEEAVTLPHVPAVSEVGQSSAKITMDYTISNNISQELKGAITSVQAGARVYRSFSFMGKVYVYGFGGDADPGVNCASQNTNTGVVRVIREERIEDLKSGEYGDYYKDITIPAGDSWSYTDGTFQSFEICGGAVTGSNISSSGTISVGLSGLISGKKYGNWSDLKGYYGYIDGNNQYSYDEGWGVWQYDASSSITADVLINFSDGSTYSLLGDTWYGALQMTPDFTTLAAAPPVTDGELKEENKGEVSAGGGEIVAGETIRIYVNDSGIVDRCKALIDKGYACVLLRGYIYSDPTTLYANNGGELIPIYRDEDGNYYAEVAVPKEFRGAHKIALYDAEGALVGWTEVDIVKFASPDTGAVGRIVDEAARSGLLAALSAVVLTAAAVLVAGYKRVRR